MELEQYFRETLVKYQKQTEDELRKFFREKIDKSDRLFKKETLAILQEYSLRPAKRIRPVLVNIGYRLAGGKDDKAIAEVSVFMELIHNMALIHDDIADQDGLRRGGKTMHFVYGGGHYGQSMAMMAGDAIGFLGEEILSSSNFPAELKLAAIRRLNWILVETNYGQMMEMHVRSDPGPVKETEVLEIYRLKTALYSFIGPLQIGAILAGAKDELLCKIEKFASPLGMAFQIQDDINDMDALKRSSRDLANFYVGQSKKFLVREDFPEKERQFLLGLADYILKGEY